eukprot:gnl/MRDRNA2_/MRDRNA2_73199_c0_seq1.p2 gnl/MRDRNA2_/MRDRNA2_73199_c0~~gnl/MRDRNA2_/MRDRNA2_73199_c0_seq1.p2  ORF type:complete len:193 (-),score=38.24 gnl/MRDRNA2_/MRDRNA2_73199_c0_seq1:844-1422(-)
MLCSVCDGTGKLLSKVCPLCDGFDEESSDECTAKKEPTLAVQEAAVTVRRMDGEVLFGPVCLPLSLPVPVLRDDVLEACWQAKMDACELCLFHGAHELADDEFLLGGESVELLAVLRSLHELSPEERASYREKVFEPDHDVWNPWEFPAGLRQFGGDNRKPTSRSSCRQRAHARDFKLLRDGVAIRTQVFEG